MPYRMRDVRQVVDEIVADQQPYVVFVDNNFGVAPGVFAQSLPFSAPAADHLERSGHDRCNGRPFLDTGDGDLRMYWSIRGLRVAERRQPD